MDFSQDTLNLIDVALREDLSDTGDITSQATIPENKIITATMQARENGVLAGVPIAEQVFKTVDKSLQINIQANDGDKIKSKQNILTIEGNAQNILKAERVALNFLCHLSGIATQTAQYVNAVKHTKAKILDTRKTLPAYRALQKYAVKMGGGTNHRFGLYDMILIKDNHIAAAGGIKPALDAVQNMEDIKVEIEVDTLEQLDDVLTHGGTDIVMLDNMTPDQLKKAVEMVDGKLTTEASGGVNMDNICKIAESGVDFISIGALTHSVKVFDIGLDIKD